MAYNLIDEKWIPVERRSGAIELIAPAEIADRADPPLRIASPLPDFDGALLEFLIGLLQTAAAPATERAWEREFESPPDIRTLRKRFDTVRDAFFLDGDGPRFMQEVKLTSDNAKDKPVGYLLIDRCGEENLGDGPSLFSKPNSIPGLSNAAAATALFLMQSRAPSGGGGGGGHFTSVRGGSALSGIIAGPDLWSTAWLNVLPTDVFSPRTETECGSRTFPWMGSKPGARRPGAPVSASAVDPAQCFWALPRRLLLSQRDDVPCAVYDDSPGERWTTLRTATVGMRYAGLMHPLSAYTRKSESEAWLPYLTPEHGFNYRDWPAFVRSTPLSQPPRVISHFAQSRRREFVDSPRLIAFGYSMDSMKPLRWIRAETPLVTVPPDRATSFAAEVDALVAASEEVRKTLSFQIKSAWSDRPGDLDVLGRVNPAFWSRTEPAFFRAVHAIAQMLDGPAGDMGRDAVREAWLADVHAAALDLFDTFVDPSAALAPTDLRRAVQARHHLDQFTRATVPKLRKLLNLPVPENTVVPKASKTPRAAKARASSKESQR
jgi:CRISPR system Cascade subunit CasA